MTSFLTVTPPYCHNWQDIRVPKFKTFFFSSFSINVEPNY
ncbi:hypothetical protein SLEP1_g915 [Rubroshorea leprosula]|uniref:Uncharacterized protein n=1 Tax=Rubroshorea leprosula TaxID=152421 RepID=A0AAV5HGS9_9ROSI|nr:hypothetical protein SLEP1_g915 [Rubroshorea leprosula]